MPEYTREQIELEKIKRNSNKSESKNHGLGHMVGKYAAIGGRSLAALPGQAVDLIELPYNLISRAVGGKGTESSSEKIKKSIDTATKGYTKPETGNQKIAEALFDFASPGVLGKMKAIHGGSKAIQSFLKPTATGAIGVGAAQHILNKEPDAHGKALLASIAPALIKGGVKSAYTKGKDLLKDEFTLSQLKQNKNVQQGVEEEIARLQGSQNINAMGHEKTGKRVILSANRQKDKFKSYFNHKYADIDKYVNKLTDFNTNEKRFVDVTDGADWLVDHYKKLEMPSLKEEFLKSKPGENLRKLLRVDRYPRSGSAENDMKIIDILIDNNVEIPKVSYNDARQLQRNIQNTLSKAQEVGSLEQGQLRQVSQKLNESIGKVFKEDPKMENLWRNTNDEYIGYLEHRKPKINEILQYKGSHSHEGKPYPGNPTGAFNLAEKKIAENPDYLDFLLEGMKDDTKDSFVRGLIRNAGKEGENYNALKGSKAISNMETPIRERLMSGLKKETRTKFEEPKGLIKQYEHEIGEPHTNPIGSYLADKAIGAVPGAFLGSFLGPAGTVGGGVVGHLAKNALYKRVTPDTTGNVITALEKKMGKPKPKISEPILSTTALEATRPGLMVEEKRHTIPLYDVRTGVESRIEPVQKNSFTYSQEQIQAEKRRRGLIQ
jgi:hypothetical protein